MIDVIAVLSRVRHFSDVAGDEAFDITPVVAAACREMADRLVNDEAAADERIINACVYLSYYRLLLRAVLSGDITDTTKAGDITVSQSPSLRLEWAARMRDESLLAAYPLLKDTEFVFEQV